MVTVIALSSAVLHGLPSTVPESHAGHGSGPPPPVLIPGAPLTYCHPVHLSAEPSPARAGETAARFVVLVDASCDGRIEPVAIEIWFRAVFFDRQRRPAFGAPHRIALLEATTDQARPYGRLRRFDVPGNGARLHAGCYIARVRIPDSGPAAQGSTSADRVADTEVCRATYPLSFPLPDPQAPAP